MVQASVWMTRGTLQGCTSRRQRPRWQQRPPCESRVWAVPIRRRRGDPKVSCVRLYFCCWRCLSHAASIPIDNCNYRACWELYLKCVVIMTVHHYSYTNNKTCWPQNIIRLWSSHAVIGLRKWSFDASSTFSDSYLSINVDRWTKQYVFNCDIWSNFFLPNFEEFPILDLLTGCMRYCFHCALVIVSFSA